MLRIVRRPECVQTLLAAFDSSSAAGQAVSDIIAAGMLPAAMEMMDRTSIFAAEAAVHANYPDCEGLLLVELDGPTDEVDTQMQRVARALRKERRMGDAPRADPTQNAPSSGRAAKPPSPPWAASRPTTSCRTASSRAPRFLPYSRASTKCLPKPACASPTSSTPATATCTPWSSTTARIEGEEARALDLSDKILELCVDAGGSITGEHGVGHEKQCVMSYMFAEPDLATMHRVRHAFDPQNLANPDKLFPTPRLCGERSRGSYVPHPIEAAGLAEVF